MAALIRIGDYPMRGPARRAHPYLKDCLTPARAHRARPYLKDYRMPGPAARARAYIGPE